MNEGINAILNRRSCRSFTREPVAREDVETILDCALRAPSAAGKQTWQFTAVMGEEKIQRLAAAAGKALSREGYDMYDPTVLIITSNRKDTKFREADNACAMENIYLSANALGLGCVWINQLYDCFDDPGVRAVLREYGVPDDHGVYGCAAIGHPAGGPRDKELVGKKLIVG